MHFFFLTRGVKHARDMFVTQAQARYWPWKRSVQQPDGTWKDETIGMVGGLQPMELWSYTFPEECMDEVLSMFDIGDGKVTPWQAGLVTKTLQKSLGAKPIPKYNKKPIIPIYREGVALYPIGIKKDNRELWKKRKGHPVLGKGDSIQENL